MRLPVPYEYYFRRYQNYCSVKNLEAPYWVKLEGEYFYLIKAVAEDLYDQSSKTNVSKGLWDYLEKHKHNPIIKDAHISDEMYNEACYNRELLVALYDDILKNKDMNLCTKNPYTVTRFGRRVIRR